MTKNLSLLRPIEAPRGLAAEIVARLTADITSGKLLPGSRLPTEQEMIAAVQENRAKVILAEAEVPLAIADAFRKGQLGISDYYNLRNLQADTDMRASIAGTANSGSSSAGKAAAAAAL